MSYQPIARKWRPDSFEGIVGQLHVTRTLQNAMRLGRVHHAFLFTGARGVGKTSAARVLARALNCEQGDGVEPCGVCGMCVEIRAGTCPDVIEIDGASNNSVEDVRDLRESVRYAPQRGRRKIYIIDEVHMLSRGAFNALLKTLEEPPEHVVFIFATTEPHKIPETILSRVQRFDFKRIPLGTVVQRLAQVCEGEGVRAQPEALRLIARAGEGSMRDSQSLLDRVISFCGEDLGVEQVTDVLGLVDRSLLYNMLQGMLQGEADRCLDCIEQVDSYGYDLNEFTAELLELLRDATVLGLSPTGQRHLELPDEERARLSAFAKDVPPEVFVRSFQVMMEVQEQVARAARPRMVLEMAVARLLCIRPARPLDQVVERLGDMERRLRQAAGSAPRPRSSRPSAKEDDEGEPARALARPAAGPAQKRWTPGADPREEAATVRAPSPVRPPAPPPRPERAPDRWAPPSDDRGGPPLISEAELSAYGFAGDEDGDAGSGYPEPDDWRSELLGPAGAGAADAALDPAPPIDEDEPEAELSAGPPLPPREASDPERFRLLQTWLSARSRRFDALALDCGFVSATTGELRIFAGNAFTYANVSRLLQEPALSLGLRQLLPGCAGVQLLRREQAPAGSLTRREQADAARVAREAELLQRLPTEPRLRRVLERLSARLVAVTLDDRAAPGAEGPPHGSA